MSRGVGLNISNVTCYGQKQVNRIESLLINIIREIIYRVDY